METTTVLSSLPPSGSRKSALFIVNILTPASHTNPQYRVASELCPGKRGIEWRAGDLAKRGYAEMLRVKLVQLVAESGYIGVRKECDSSDADLAALNGHEEVIRDLRTHG